MKRNTRAFTTTAWDCHEILLRLFYYAYYCHARGSDAHAPRAKPVPESRSTPFEIATAAVGTTLSHAAANRYMPGTVLSCTTGPQKQYPTGRHFFSTVSYLRKNTNLFFSIKKTCVFFFVFFCFCCDFPRTVANKKKRTRE